MICFFDEITGEEMIKLENKQMNIEPILFEIFQNQLVIFAQISCYTIDY
jgi:hypothetical protein